MERDCVILRFDDFVIHLFPKLRLTKPQKWYQTPLPVLLEENS
jgi:hypothetical protein